MTSFNLLTFFHEDINQSEFEDSVQLASHWIKSVRENVKKIKSGHTFGLLAVIKRVTSTVTPNTSEAQKGCFPFSKSKNGFLILDLPDSATETQEREIPNRICNFGNLSRQKCDGFSRNDVLFTV